MSSSESRKDRARQEKVLRELEKEVPVHIFQYDVAGLVYHGPIINTDITITDQHKDALLKVGRSVPNSVRARFLLDTGADGCLVKHEIAEKAGLKLINPSSPLHGIGVDTTGKTYFGRIIFTCESRKHSGNYISYAVDVEIQSGDLKTDRIDGLIGRTVLRHFETIYNGMTGQVTIRVIGKSTAKKMPNRIIGY